MSDQPVHYIDLDTQPYWEEHLAAQGQRQLEAWLRRRVEFEQFYARRASGATTPVTDNTSP